MTRNKIKMISTFLAMQMIEDIRTNAPIVTSLLDDDKYKFTINQFLWAYHHDVVGGSSFKNRSVSIPLAKIVPKTTLNMHLKSVQKMRFSEQELAVLAKEFQPDYIEYLRNFRFSSYRLTDDGDQYQIHFDGLLPEVSLWEIHCLQIVSELKTRYVIGMILNEFENMKRAGYDKSGRTSTEFLAEFYELALGLIREDAIAYEKMGAKVIEMGTRRRHSKNFQNAVLNILHDHMPKTLVGTSNMEMGNDLGIDTKGTNAHECYMLYATLARKLMLDGQATEEDVIESQYEFLRRWADMYPHLKTMLPDAYGTDFFFANCPADLLASYTGSRIDSKKDIVAAVRQNFEVLGCDPNKTSIPSDGLDRTKVESMHVELTSIMNIVYGIGTSLTNNVDSISVRALLDNPTRRMVQLFEWLKPASLVCKLTNVLGVPAVKLSDNPNKATGPKEEVEFFLRLCGHSGMEETNIIR